MGLFLSAFVVRVDFDIHVKVVSFFGSRLDLFKVRKSRVLGLVDLCLSVLHLFDLLFNNFGSNHTGVLLKTGHNSNM